MTNSMDPDQTAPIGAVCSGSTLFASILEFASNVRQLFAADDFNRRHFSDAFFLGALRVNLITKQYPLTLFYGSCSLIKDYIICNSITSFTQ